MQLHNGTGCQVILIGTVIVMPSSSQYTEPCMIVNRNRPCSKIKKEKLESYRVVLSQHDTQRIRQFGFPGMLVSVLGDLSTDNKAEIIAEKIEFMHFPHSNQSEIIFKNMKWNEFHTEEMSYWYTRDGLVRQELTYIH